MSAGARQEFVDDKFAKRKQAQAGIGHMTAERDAYLATEEMRQRAKGNADAFLLLMNSLDRSRAPTAGGSDPWPGTRAARGAARSSAAGSQAYAASAR